MAELVGAKCGVGSGCGARAFRSVALLPFDSQQGCGRGALPWHEPGAQDARGARGLSDENARRAHARPRRMMMQGGCATSERTGRAGRGLTRTTSPARARRLSTGIVPKRRPYPWWLPAVNRTMKVHGPCRRRKPYIGRQLVACGMRGFPAGIWHRAHPLHRPRH